MITLGLGVFRLVPRAKIKSMGAVCFFHLGFRAIAHPTQALLYRLQDNGN